MKSFGALVAVFAFTAVAKSSIKAPFTEVFDSNWEARWNPSNAVKEIPADLLKKQDAEDAESDSKVDPDLYRYRGEWQVEAPLKDAVEGDVGLVAKTAAAHHAISVAFDKVVDTDGKDLVIQYDLKFQEELQCGGAYIKLLSDSKSGIKYQEFDDKTPYTIMFGPDKCGSTNKVHFIFRHRNPRTGEITEKHLTGTPAIKSDGKTNLYTAIVHPDNSMEIYINKEKVKSANLLTDFEPPVNPPKEIDDTTDSKPEDWVDEARIANPDAVKPEDWDEEAPRMIENTDATMPEDWLADEEQYVPDPAAEKPEDWDDEEDGEWVAPSVPNPLCAQVSGCGKWTQPMIANPDYKGKWYPEMIDNPEYKGVWTPRKIPNENFYEDKTPSKFTKFSGIGIEIWTMQANIMFDDFYVGHSLDDAFKFADQTWKIRRDAEDATAVAEKPEADKAAESTTDAVKGEVNQYVEFVKALIADPVTTAKAQPTLLAALLAVILAPVLLYSLLSGNSIDVKKAVVGNAKKLEKKTKDDDEPDGDYVEDVEEQDDSAVEADDEKEASTSRKRRNK